MSEESESRSPATLQFRYATNLPLPIERTADFIWKPEAMMHWVPWVRSVTYAHNTRDGQFGVGSARTVRLIGGISVVEVITRLDPGILCAYRLVSASLGRIPVLQVSWLVDGHEGEMRISSNADGGTHLQWSTYFEPYRGRRSLASLVRWLFSSLVRRMVRNMEEACLREQVMCSKETGECS